MAQAELPFSNFEIQTMIKTCIAAAQRRGAASDDGRREQNDIRELQKLYYFLSRVHPRSTVTYSQDDVELLWRYK